MKKFFSVFLALITISVFFSFPAQAIVLSSKEYSMYYYDNHKIAIEEYIGKDTVVKIPAEYKTLPITRIDSYAFYYKNVVSVEIPDSVLVLGDNVFEKCRFLKSCYISDSVVKIGGKLFNRCGSLEEVVLGRGITSIPVNMFYGCVSLSSIVIPPEIEDIDPLAFQSTTVDLTIYGYSSSYAQTFAENNGYNFVALDLEQNVSSEETFNENELEDDFNIPDEDEIGSEPQAEEIVNSSKTSSKSAKKISDKTDTQKKRVSETSNAVSSQTEQVDADSMLYKSYIISAIIIATIICAILIVLILKKKRNIPSDNDNNEAKE